METNMKLASANYGQINLIKFIESNKYDNAKFDTFLFDQISLIKF